MNQRSDIDRVLEIWMGDGPTAIPDRVVDIVAARIGVQRQHRAWPFRGRTNMNNQIKLFAAPRRGPRRRRRGLQPSAGRQPARARQRPPPPHRRPSPASPPTCVRHRPPRQASRSRHGTRPADSGGAGFLAAGSHDDPGLPARVHLQRPGGFVTPEGFGTYVNDMTQRTSSACSRTRLRTRPSSPGPGPCAIHPMGPHESPYFVCDACGGQFGRDGGRNARRSGQRRP